MKYFEKYKSLIIDWQNVNRKVNEMKVVVGTRGSKLALTQTKWVVRQLQAYHPEVTFDIKIIKTKGDKIQNIPLDKIGDKGLFVKEIEQQLLEGEIDLAVHSMKDMPSEVCEGLRFTYTPLREDARDVLILKHPIQSLSELPQGARIGTGSKRRKYQLLAKRPDLQIEPIRGNIDTRISKIETQNLEGIVLAAAGVKRLGRASEISYYLPLDIMVPAPAQGALALEIRKDDAYVYELVRPIEDFNSQMQITAERAFLEGVNGSCHLPIGAYATLRETKMHLMGLLGDEEGAKLVRRERIKDCTSIEEAKNLGKELAVEVMEALK